MDKYKLDNYSSFSSVVNELQGDKVKGSLAIVHFNKLESLEKERLEQMKNDVAQKQLEITHINKAIVNIGDHLKLEAPTVIASEYGTFIIDNQLNVTEVKQVL